MLSKDQLLASASRILHVVFSLGLVDPLDQQPYRDLGSADVQSMATKQLNLEAARQGIVLLQNRPLATAAGTGVGAGAGASENFEARRGAGAGAGAEENFDARGLDASGAAEDRGDREAVRLTAVAGRRCTSSVASSRTDTFSPPRWIAVTTPLRTERSGSLKRTRSPIDRGARASSASPSSAD